MAILPNNAAVSPDGVESYICILDGNIDIEYYGECDLDRIPYWEGFVIPSDKHETALFRNPELLVFEAWEKLGRIPETPEVTQRKPRNSVGHLPG